MADFQLQIGFQVPYVIQEFSDAAGTLPIAALPTDVTTVVSANTASLTVAPDATPVVLGAAQTGFLVAGTTAATAISVTATVTPAGLAALIASVLVDVIATTPPPPPPAASIGITLGTPVAIPTPAAKK